jgi:tRNA threonylcarbamoyladenosine dehydratase
MSQQKEISYSASSSNAFVFLTLGFVAGCSVASTLSYVLYRQTSPQKQSATSVQETKSKDTNSVVAINTSVLPKSNASSLPYEIREEQLSRHLLYFGRDGLDRLQKARVCVVGVGGVGSHAAHMLARSGIRYLRLIDFDQVSVSSLNRHACATLADVGTSKVECLAQFLRRICPDPQYLQIDAVPEMYTAESGARLLQLPSSSDAPWDMVLDCIDDCKTKAALLAYCLQRKIRVLSCMGAGGKADPTRLHLSDLRSAAKDPLATKIRQFLKNAMKSQLNGNTNETTASYLDDMDQLTVLYSSEKTVVTLADFTEEQKQTGVRLYGAVDRMRIRIVPVLGTMPAIMGQALASYCITTVAGVQRIQPVTTERIGRNSRNKMYQMLRTREQCISTQVRSQVQAHGALATVEGTISIHGVGELVTLRNSDGIETSKTWIGELQIDQGEDVEYLLEIWRNRCAVTGARLGTVLHLVRWDRSLPSTCDNLVIISADILKPFEHDPELYKETMNPAIRKSIEDRLASTRIDR